MLIRSNKKQPRLNPGLRRNLAVLSVLIAFFFVNLEGLTLAIGVSAFVLCTVAFVVLRYTDSQSFGPFPVYLPVIFSCLGLLFFHFGWSANSSSGWVAPGVPEEYVAAALLYVAVVMLAVMLGARLAMMSRSFLSDPRLFAQNSAIYRFIGLAFVIIGTVAQIWALQNGLLEFSVVAYGIDFSTFGSPLVTILLSLQPLVGVGQIVLLGVVIQDNPRASGRPVSLRQHGVLKMILVASFMFDLIIRFQSAAKATMLVGFVPILVTLYVFGYRRIVVLGVITGIVVYSIVVYPLANALRFDPAYRNSLSSGQLFLPGFSYLTGASSGGSTNVTDSLARLNQTSLLSFSIRRISQGLPTLDGTPYQNAIATAIPRFLLPGRVDRMVSYDSYTGYLQGYLSYNNWGLHTEAYLNFGLFGAILVMTLMGFFWQKAYGWILRFEGPVGWAIVASILLPSIFRAGEYGFLNTVTSLARTIFLVMICTKILVWSVRIVSRQHPTFDASGRAERPR